MSSTKRWAAETQRERECARFVFVALFLISRGTRIPNCKQARRRRMHALPLSGKTRFSRWKSVRRSKTKIKKRKEFQEFVAHKRARKTTTKM